MTLRDLPGWAQKDGSVVISVGADISQNHVANVEVVLEDGEMFTSIKGKKYRLVEELTNDEIFK